VSRLARKLGRDLFRLKGQVFTIGLVLACGIMSMIMLRSTWDSLVSSRDAYYTDYRFADVFARLKRAPEPVARRLEAIPGVARVYTRVVEDVMVPIPDQPEPVTGRIVSIPSDGELPLNGLHLRSGRLPEPGAEDEVVVLEQFAEAHGMRAGDPIPAVLNGHLRQLRVVGTAMSPEYIFALAGHQLIADDRRFAVLWMHRDAVAPIFRMEGAFNDVVLDLQPGANLAAVLDAADRALQRYGGFHAVGRDRQLSSYALSGELENLRNLAVMIPLVFLGVAAFLVNVVVSRLVFLERSQIAVLKALGFRDLRIGVHYLGLVAVIVAVAAVLGVAGGVWSGTWMTDLYTDFFRFPNRAYRLSPSLVVVTIGVGLVAAVIGALASVRQVARMPPAEAMRPPAPLRYRRSALERLGPGSLIGPSVMMIAREIGRRPLRFLLSVAGIAMGIAIFVMGRFSWDSFDNVMGNVFVREHREDMIVSFIEPLPRRAVRTLEAIPGVLVAEGQRAAPVRFRAGSRSRDAILIGIPHPSELRQLVHDTTIVLVPPPDGVIMTDRLAGLLGVRPGDQVWAEILEGSWPERQVTVTALIAEPFGLQAYGRAEWMGRLLREEPRVTAALLRIDPARAAEVRQRLKQMRGVIGATSRQDIIDKYREQTGESMWVIALILTLSAAAIATGVVYNNARIALSLRSRDLASLRVLGFTRVEISSMLLGELAVQVLLGIPLGLWLGNLWARAYAASIDPEVMWIPLHIADTTYGAGALIALLSGVVSALLVRRKLDELDLVAVLKTSE
jgi:putative ABC transport system permease protein